MGWDRLYVVQPRELKSSDNMLAELFEVHIHCRHVRPGTMQVHL